MRNVYVILLLLGLVAGCAKHTHHSDGGQDGGGGTTLASTPEQVRDAIREAYRLATDTDSRRNILIRFLIDYADFPGQQDIIDPERLFPKLPEPFKDDGSHFVVLPKNDDSQFASPVIEALRNHPPTLLEHGDCSQPQPKHADASVSQLNLNGQVCFSIGNLTRIAPTSLQGEILSLLVHEASHLGGADEVEAVEWQKLFTTYFASRFGSLSNEFIYARNITTWAQAHHLLEAAAEIVKSKADTSQALIDLGQAEVLMKSTPYYLDPLMLELGLKPKRRDLVNNYSNSILALVESMAATHGHGGLLALINQDIAGIQTVRANFYAFADGAGAATCVLPKGTLNIDEAVPLPPVEGAIYEPVRPPAKCDAQ